MDLTEAEEIKKRWQEYTEELYQKGLKDPDNHTGVVTHLEPDILECKVNGPQEALLPAKLVQVMKFQLSCIKPQKTMLLKCCTQYASNLENSAVATELEKVRFHSSSKERQCQRMFKAKHCRIVFVSMLTR